MIAQRVFPGWHETLIDCAVETLRLYEPKDKPYWGCFSGGKDSVVIKELARLAGVAVEWHYNVTTIDPPELTRFIKRKHPDVARDKPPKTFAQLVLRKGPPTRRMRWCCEALKEQRSERGRRLILGVRAAESPRRAANWQTFTFHRKTREYAVLPILRWKDDDVWRLIRERQLPYCELYDQGHKRLGCIGCPMSRGARIRDFERWPAIGGQIKAAFVAWWNRRRQEGAGTRMTREFADAHEAWDWWLSDNPMPRKDDCQGALEFWSNES
ncbi:MAG: phosphoadenosine phosphosulfate reductase family protein [Thermoguttaceae bacterium]|nr:phosphoadenosine phosphosulfate reductase family protein [Thermoguttaceae bacterium]